AKSLTKPEASIVEQNGAFVLKSNRFDPAVRLPSHTPSRERRSGSVVRPRLVQLPSARGCLRQAPQRTFTSLRSTMPSAPPARCARLRSAKHAHCVQSQGLMGKGTFLFWENGGHFYLVLTNQDGKVDPHKNVG